MASWVCHICGFRHGDYEETCFGCHHGGDSLEHYIDCPKCGRETKKGVPWCEFCQESMDDEQYDDEFDEETSDLDADFGDELDSEGYVE